MTASRRTLTARRSERLSLAATDKIAVGLPEAAELTSISIRTLRRLVLTGVIPASKLDPSSPKSPWLVTPDALRAFVIARRVSVGSVPPPMEGHTLNEHRPQERSPTM